MYVCLSYICHILSVFPIECIRVTRYNIIVIWQTSYSTCVGLFTLTHTNHNNFLEMLLHFVCCTFKPCCHTNGTVYEVMLLIWNRKCFQCDKNVFLVITVLLNIERHDFMSCFNRHGMWHNILSVKCFA